MTQADFFPDTKPPASPLIGIKVHLGRDGDLKNQCHSGVAVVVEGAGPHQLGVRCDVCGRHRAWLSKETINFLTRLVGLYGQPLHPITVRSSNPEIWKLISEK